MHLLHYVCDSSILTWLGVKENLFAWEPPLVGRTRKIKVGTLPLIGLKTWRKTQPSLKSCSQHLTVSKDLLESLLTLRSFPGILFDLLWGNLT